jgi:hypothetical protein
MKYCISWLSFYSNDLHSKLVTVDSFTGALILALKELVSAEHDTFELPDFGDDPEKIKQYAFDCEGAINAVCVE